jgi:hypothetical protein
LHEGHGIEGGNPDTSARVLLHDDIAWEHGPDLVLKCDRTIGELRIARAENTVRAKFLVELRLQNGLSIRKKCCVEDARLSMLPRSTLNERQRAEVRLTAVLVSGPGFATLADEKSNHHE